jgi:hypothetical protein
MRSQAIGFAAASLLISAPAIAQPWAALPHQPVSSQIGMMNELQKRGPNAYVYGPYAGGQYVVVGPITEPYYATNYRPRARKYRSHRR